VQRGARPWLIVFITGIAMLTVDLQAQEPITLFTGRQHISTAWEVCLQAKHAVHAEELLFFEFEDATNWTLSMDGHEVQTFTGKPYYAYSGSIEPGTHLVKIAVKKPATLLFIRGYEGVELCP
jgi:hypothetical protein